MAKKKKLEEGAPAEELETTAAEDGEDTDEEDDEEDGEEDGEDMAEAEAAASVPARRPKSAGKPVSSRDILSAVRLVTGKGTLAEQRRALLGMHRELTSLREEAAESRVSAIEARVESAISAGKLAPSQKAFAVKLGKSDPAMLDEYLSGATPIVKRSPTKAEEPIDAKKLGSIKAVFTSADERAYQASGLEAQGITREQYSAQKADVIKQQSALQ